MINIKLGVFRLDSMILVFSLIICCSTYVRGMKPDLLNKHRKGLGGFFRRCAVIGVKFQFNLLG